MSRLLKAMEHKSNQPVSSTLKPIEETKEVLLDQLHYQADGFWSNKDC